MRRLANRQHKEEKMKNAILAGLVAAFAAVAGAKDFTVVEKGEARAVVCVDSPGLESAKHAANELVKYVKAMTGAELKIVKCPEAAGSANVIRISAAKGMKRDEISIKVGSSGRELSVTGDWPRGCLYATYELLEMWGVRFFGVKTEKVPKADTLTLPENFSHSYAPPFEMRQPGSVALDMNAGPAWAVKLRVSRNYQNKKLGGKWDSVIGSGHSLGNRSFVDAEKYFDAHPEWYALINGKRTRKGQLCHSNGEMRKHLLGEVLAKLEARKKSGGMKILNLSYLDNTRFCTCKGCKSLRKKYGDAKIGPALDIANFVGKAIEKDHPDVKVVTLAYWDWREMPPKIPEPMNANVYVRLCQNGNKALPLKSQKDIMARLQGWSKIVPGRLMIWDWDACFRNYLTPYPTYHLYGEDFRTYRELGVKHILSQLPHGAIFADFVEMRTYLYAKLAWNPDLDGEAMAKEWIDHCCGAGAPRVWEYYKLVEHAVWGRNPGKRETRHKLHGYNPGRSWLSARDIARAYALLEEAEKATAGDKAANDMVRCIGAGLLELAIERYDEVLPQMKGRKFPSRLELVDRFERLGKDFSVWCFREGPSPRKFDVLVEQMRGGGL